MNSRTFLVVAVIAAATAFIGTSASAAGATTAPLTLHIEQTPHKVIGSRLVPGAPPAADICSPDQVGNPYTTTILELRWHGSGGTGTLHYDVYTAYEPVSDSDFTLAVKNTTATAFRFAMTNNDSDCGGGADQKAFKIVARDAAGDKKTSFAFTVLTDIVQQDGTSLGVFSTHPHTIGTWHTAHCLCFDGGTSLYSTAAGASVSYSMNLWQGERIALAADENINRGKVSIRVDNGTATVIDTYSSHAGAPVIVWEHHVKRDGVHTITITNLGTPGRSRVDVDSFIL